MDRRGPLLFLLLCCAASGCASLKTFVADDYAAPPVEVPKMTPAQAYDSGAMNAARGDYVAARRDWNRCLAMSSPESSARMDCLVALERLAGTSSNEP
ncbi:MAG: hypothetical protein ACHQ51_05575 [Elusimicrobiota bacterium]